MARRRNRTGSTTALIMGARSAVFPLSEFYYNLGGDVMTIFAVASHDRKRYFLAVHVTADATTV